MASRRFTYVIDGDWDGSIEHATVDAVIEKYILVRKQELGTKNVLCENKKID
jgi:hypothetical protein